MTRLQKDERRRCSIFLATGIPLLLGLAASCMQSANLPGVFQRLSLKDREGITALAAELPAIPSARETSEVIGTTIKGSEFYDKSFNASIDGDALKLTSGSNTLSWGIWELNPGDDDLIAVEFQLSLENNDSAWVAVADYSKGSWSIDGPLETGKQFSLSDVVNRQSGGNSYVAVITYGGNRCTVEALVLTVDRSAWNIVTVDNNGDVGGYPSLAVIDGKPAISYFDFSLRRVKYARSSTIDGAGDSDWQDIVSVASGLGEFGGYTSLAVVNGNPAFTYYNYTEQVLYFAASQTSTGTNPGDWATVQVLNPSSGNYGVRNSLAVVDGNPAVSYLELDAVSIIYTRSTTPSGLGLEDWLGRVRVDSYFSSPTPDTSLAVVNGKPALSYFDTEDNKLLFAYSQTTTGSAEEDWTRVVAVDTGIDSVFSCALSVVDGNPAIAFCGGYPGGARYIRSTTATGDGRNAWAHGDISIDSSDNQGWYVDLSIVGGKPAVAYHDLFRQELSFAQATSASGAGDFDWGRGQIQVVDDVGHLDLSGIRSSLAEVDGKPAIAYYSADYSELRYAILLE